MNRMPLILALIVATAAAGAGCGGPSANERLASTLEKNIGDYIRIDAQIRKELGCTPTDQRPACQP